jgi:hypothetical protein
MSKVSFYPFGSFPVSVGEVASKKILGPRDVAGESGLDYGV